jgi:hypothetical protein
MVINYHNIMILYMIYYYIIIQFIIIIIINIIVFSLFFFLISNDKCLMLFVWFRRGKEKMILWKKIGNLCVAKIEYFIS